MKLPWIGRMGWMATLGGLLGLFLILKPSGVNLREYRQLTACLNRVAEVDARLNVGLLRALNADRHNYDAVSGLSAELEALRSKIEILSSSVNDKQRAELQALEAELANTILRKRELTERFKTEGAVLKNSRAWLLASARDWNQGVVGLGASPEYNEEIAQAIRGVVELLLYHGESIEEFSPALVQSNLDELQEQLIAARVSEASLAYFHNLRRHVDIFAQRLPRIRALVDQIVALPLAGQAEELTTRYAFHHHQSLQSVAYGRALAALLLLFSAYQLLSGMALANQDRFVLKKQVAERELQLEGELEERKKTETTLRDVAEAVSGESSDAFFQNLLNRITVALDLQYAFIGRWSERSPDEIKTVVVSAQGAEAENVCYSLTDAPCANVVGRALCCYPDNVGNLFPEDQMLIDMGVVSYCGAPLFDSKGQPIGLLVVMDTKPFANIELVESVTQIVSARVADELERSAVEAAVREEKEQFSVMLRSIGDGVIATDLEGRVVLINKEAERLTGWSQRDAVDRDLSEVFKIMELSSGRPYSNLLKQVVETGQLLILSDIYRLVRRDGSSCLINDSCAPIFDAQKEIIGVIVVFRDVSEKKQVEDEKNRIEGQLLQLQKMETIGTLAGGIAHEFNNLLTPIVGYASVCLELIPSAEEAHKHVEMILSGSLRAQKLVAQMSKFGRQYKLEHKPVQLQHTVESAADLIRSVAPSTISVDVSVLGDLGMVLCDENQIHQVVINLCTNAYLAMEPEGGRLGITIGRCAEVPSRHVDPERKYLEIAISDTGCGIPPAVKSRIFDPFFTTRGVGQGTGLGLSVALGIVESHGGTIELESTVGEGTTFVVYLPEAENLKFSHQPKLAEVPQVVGNSERILFIDDEPEITEMAKVLLGQYGYDLTVATDSFEALELFRKSPLEFDVVITDYTMPGMKGLELGRSMLSVRPDIPILLTTGNSHSISEEKVLSEGFFALVMKPIMGQQLRAAIQKAVRSQSAAC